MSAGCTAVVHIVPAFQLGILSLSIFVAISVPKLLNATFDPKSTVKRDSLEHSYVAQLCGCINFKDYQVFS